MAIADRIEYVKLDRLLLDPENPRLGRSLSDRTQDEMMRYIERRYEPIIVARSIALHGYFPSEPLIVIPGPGGKFTAVEGNRRLVALKLLSDEAARAALGRRRKEWDKLAEKAELPARGVPVVKVGSRDEVAPIIGYRHIAGIEEWEPYPKSVFIARFIDEEGLSFADVAELVGESESDVRASYRNYSVVEQAREKFALDTSKVEGKFGVFTRAMESAPIRTYIGAPTPGQVRGGHWPMHETKKEEAADVFSWLFGDSENDPIVSDSRDVPDLGRAIRTPEGLETLRASRDLEAALEAAEGSRKRLMSRLSRANNALLAARQDIGNYARDPEVRVSIEACAANVADLEAVINA
jgi:hypothetical protein